MKPLLVLFAFFAAVMQAQTISHCRQRFDRYLNFRGTLSPYLKFESDVFYFQSGGKKIMAVYQEELPALAQVFESLDVKEQAEFMRAKGLRKLNRRERDSLLVNTDDMRAVIRKRDSLPLRGYRIAIDPGHFGTNLKDAQVEQKFLYFTKPGPQNADTVMLFESSLTFSTARILQEVLTQQGAEVFMTRNRADHTSFDCTFSEWQSRHRSRTLDSLRRSGQLSPAKYEQLKKSNDYNFFWNFFRDYDLANRAARVNAFRPHVTLIIHYNVDEKNAPWKSHTPKNFTMAFIGGAYTPDNLQRDENRMHLLRMMVTDQLDRSASLAAQTVSNFNKQLNVPVATAGDALYLQQNCMYSGKPGVFSRNLVLCRKINSPLVYGESLYQDNEKECAELMKCDVDAYGVKTSSRLVKVADCYYQAVLDYLLN